MVTIWEEILVGLKINSDLKRRESHGEDFKTREGEIVDKLQRRKEDMKRTLNYANRNRRS